MKILPKEVFMAIARQFAGLDMGQLIGGPLNAAADASVTLARGTADFINEVGFDKSGKIRTAAFGFSRKSMNDDGTSNLESLNVDVPLLAIVPIPNLQIDEVNVIFDMEVKQSEKSESSRDMGASLSGSLRIGPVKVSITGSVSAHQSNTRSSDNSAKYHVDVRATNHGTPEGLARVLDMIAAGISPSLVGSELRDGNGQALPEAGRRKAERLRVLRAEIGELESRRDAARRMLDDRILALKNVAREQLNVYDAQAAQAMRAGDGKDDGDAVSAAIGAVDSSWNDFMSRIADRIQLVADSEKRGDEAVNLLALKAFKDGAQESYTSNEAKYGQFVTAQDNAVESCRNLKKIDDDLLAKRGEYNTAIAAPAAAETSS